MASLMCPEAVFSRRGEKAKEEISEVGGFSFPATPFREEIEIHDT